MTMHIVHELPQDAWDAFVLENPRSVIHHTRAMFQVWERAKGFHPRLWACVSRDAILALFIPVEINLANGPLRPYTSRSVSYGSLLYVDGTEGMKAVDELLHAYTQDTNTNSLFTELRNRTELAEIQPALQANGFAFEPHLNYLIDLKVSMGDVWGKLSKSIRKHIRTAQKNNLVVEDVTDETQAQAVYELLERTYARIHVPLPGLTFFQAAFHVLIPRGMLKVRLIRCDGIPISTRLSLVYKDRILDWYTGSDRSYQKAYPEEFAIWQILQWGREHGYAIFDFGGAGRPDEYYGPRVFKQRFGGTLVNYGRNMFIHSPERLKISKFVYGLYRKGLRIPFRSFSESDKDISLKEEHGLPGGSLPPD